MICAASPSTGFLSEQAQIFVCSLLDNDNIYTLDMVVANLADIEQHLLPEGYAMYTEDWSNYFVNKETSLEKPINVVPDDGVYEAYYNAKAAFQDNRIMEYQGEDCLYLNLWKADETSAEKKPVMVWIHGGAFVSGGTGIELFDCANLVSENPDLIVVTVAYRLGVLGFLNLSHLADGKDYPDSQNLGLLDQKMALKWVHENIANEFFERIH